MTEEEAQQQEALPLSTTQMIEAYLAPARKMMERSLQRVRSYGKTAFLVESVASTLCSTFREGLVLLVALPDGQLLYKRLAGKQIAFVWRDLEGELPLTRDEELPDLALRIACALACYGYETRYLPEEFSSRRWPQPLITYDEATDFSF